MADRTVEQVTARATWTVIKLITMVLLALGLITIAISVIVFAMTQ